MLILPAAAPLNTDTPFVARLDATEQAVTQVSYFHAILQRTCMFICVVPVCWCVLVCAGVCWCVLVCMHVFVCLYACACDVYAYG